MLSLTILALKVNPDALSVQPKSGLIHNSIDGGEGTWMSSIKI